MANDAPEYVSARQRARNNTSGVNAARVLRGQAPANESEEARPNTGRRHGTAPHSNYASPREFFGGPRQPPRQSSGIRRNPEANRDTVGLMLTDEYLMMSSGNNNQQQQSNNNNNNRSAQARPATAGAGAGAGAGANAGAANGSPARGAQNYGAAAKRGQGTTRARDAYKASRSGDSHAVSAAHAPGGHREGLTYNCIVTAPEKEWRSGVKITQPSGGMDAPYFEDTDPRPARETPAVTGKRHVRPPQKDAKMFGQVPPPKEGEEDTAIQSSLPPCRKTANKANESVDVLNLYCYSPEELSEKPQPYKQLGPRKYVAPDMPARKQPMIHPINSPAKQEHDVLGTGRWGVPEKDHARGVARGSCRPPRDTANLFRGGVAPAAEESAPRSYQPAPRRNSAGEPEGEHRGSERRDSRQVEPFRVDLRGGSPKKRPDPVFTEADRPHKILSKKNAGSPDLLRYYDPNLDTKPAQSPPKRNAQRANQETHELTAAERRPAGRGRGEFSGNNRDSVVLAYA